MAKAHCLVLAGNGTNCEVETAHACKLAGADRTDIVPIWDLLAGDVRLDDYNFLLLPGGFLDGDDLGAAKAMAWRLQTAKTATGESILAQLKRFVDEPRLVLGICNGFQLLTKLGLLPWADRGQKVTVWANDSGRFEDRWVRLKSDADSPSVFTKGIDDIWLPIRHGEGKVLFAREEDRDDAERHHLVPFRYADPKTGEPTERYPHNPNGSPGGIAGLTSPSGRIFGLMPHPEAYNHRTNSPTWPRQPADTKPAGIALFVNAMDWLKKNG